MITSLNSIRSVGLLILLITSYQVNYAQTFRVMSLNILDGGSTRLDTIFQILKDQQADIMLVQETSNLDDRFSKKAAAYGYQMVQNNIGMGIYQPAILSKFKILDHGNFFRAIHATIELPGGVHLKVFNTHWLPLNLNDERIFSNQAFSSGSSFFDTRKIPSNNRW